MQKCMHEPDPQTPTPSKMRVSHKSSSGALRTCALVLLLSLPACTTPERDEFQALYTEEEPYFKTCALRHGGTYRERELQHYPTVDIYQEPAPDAGPITEECIVRQ